MSRKMMLSDFRYGIDIFRSLKISLNFKRNTTLMKCKSSNKENNTYLKDIGKKKKNSIPSRQTLAETLVTRTREYCVWFFQALLLEDFLISYFLLHSSSLYFWAFWIAVTFGNCFSLYLLQFLFILLTIYQKKWPALLPNTFLTPLHLPSSPHSLSLKPPQFCILKDIWQCLEHT